MQVVSVGIAGEKSGAISGPQNLLANVCYQHDLSLQDIDELLRPAMPVPLAGPGAWVQFEKVDANLLEPCGHREPASKLVLTWRVEGFWIPGAG